MIQDTNTTGAADSAGMKALKEIQETWHKQPATSGYIAPYQPYAPYQCPNCNRCPTCGRSYWPQPYVTYCSN